MHEPHKLAAQCRCCSDVCYCEAVRMYVGEQLYAAAGGFTVMTSMSSWNVAFGGISLLPTSS